MNEFNDYFSNVADEVMGQLPKLSNIYQPSGEFSKFLKYKLTGKNKFSIPQITIDTVYSYICNLEERKATGLDSISTQMIIRAGPLRIAPVLCDIINTSLKSGTFPSLWKLAKVIPLYKSGSAVSVNNYRPISILPVTSKIFERHVHDVLYEYFTANDLMCDQQFGFRKGRACLTCLSSMIEKWYNYINFNKLIGCVALDFRKAFDVLPHKILLSKLFIWM